MKNYPSVKEIEQWIDAEQEKGGADPLYGNMSAELITMLKRQNFLIICADLRDLALGIVIGLQIAKSMDEVPSNE